MIGDTYEYASSSLQDVCFPDGCHMNFDTAPRSSSVWFFVFFFQAEDGIRDYKVTGVQTCALPISGRSACTRDRPWRRRRPGHPNAAGRSWMLLLVAAELEAHRRHHPVGEFRPTAREIGRASCRERV